MEVGGLRGKPSQSCPTVLPSDMTDNESTMAYRSTNLVTGRQLRAARTLAGMTQRDLATVLAVNERAFRFCAGFSDACIPKASTRSHDRRPRSAKARNRGPEGALFRRCDLWGVEECERRFSRGRTYGRTAI